VSGGGAVNSENDLFVGYAGANNTGTLTINNGGTGGGLTKNGLGALVLSGTSTYTGATVVNAGRPAAGWPS